MDGKEIFSHKKDGEDFLDRLKDLCEQEALSIYAWTLMDNHFHLLARTGKLSLSDSMRKLLTGYVVNYNRRHKRYGHLFQNRYKFILCEEDPYLLELTRYIHLNPIRAGKVKDMRALRNWGRSGHSAIMGVINRPWQDRETILVYFGKSRKRAIEKYEQFVEDGITAGGRPELVGGGLIRSLGGWSQVLSIKRSGTKVFSDERILGSSDFVKDAIKEAEEKERETLRLSLKLSDFASLTEKICQREGMDRSVLCSGIRKREVVKSRRIFCQLAVKRMGYSGANVARFLGITTSAVNRLAVSDEIPEIMKYL
jgi:REP element-mobilizing transposase RayT